LNHLSAKVLVIYQTFLVFLLILVLSLKVLYSFELVIPKLVILDFMIDALGTEDLGL